MPPSPCRSTLGAWLLICLSASLGPSLAFITVVAQPSVPGSCREPSSTRAYSAAGVQYGGIAHAGVLVSNTPKSLEFYLGVLGFEDDTYLRPNLPFAGAFVRAGAQQIHLMELPNPDPTTGRPQHGGRDRHVAFTIASIDPLISRLDSKGWAFTMSASGRRAVFCRDPDGNALEFMEDATLATGGST